MHREILASSFLVSMNDRHVLADNLDIMTVFCRSEQLTNYSDTLRLQLHIWNAESRI